MSLGLFVLFEDFDGDFPFSKIWERVSLGKSSTVPVCSAGVVLEARWEVIWDCLLLPLFPLLDFCFVAFFSGREAIMERSSSSFGVGAEEFKLLILL